MDNPEYIFQVLEVFSTRCKNNITANCDREIPRELEEYISYVARTGDPVFQWSLVRVLIKEKLMAVLQEFVESSSSALNVPECPNVDAFDYENLKNTLLTQLDSFALPPFTIQRICELLAAPRKEYNRIDKYMRAVEKNVLVVSASDFSLKRALETPPPEGATSNDTSTINGIILFDKTDSPEPNLASFGHHSVFEPDRDDQFSSPAATSSNNVDSANENDAVQRIIDDSWSETNQDVQHTLNVTFENELQQFVTDESGCTEPRDKIEKTQSTFDGSVMEQHAEQNIIEPDVNLSFESLPLADVNEDGASSMPSNNTFEFKDATVDHVDDSAISSGELFSKIETKTNDATDNKEEMPVASDQQHFQEAFNSEYVNLHPNIVESLDQHLGEKADDALAATIEKMSDVVTSHIAEILFHKEENESDSATEEASLQFHVEGAQSVAQETSSSTDNSGEGDLRRGDESEQVKDESSSVVQESHQEAENSEN